MSSLLAPKQQQRHRHHHGDKEDSSSEEQQHPAAVTTYNNNNNRNNYNTSNTKKSVVAERGQRTGVKILTTTISQDEDDDNTNNSHSAEEGDHYDRNNNKKKKKKTPTLSSFYRTNKTTTNSIPRMMTMMDNLDDVFDAVESPSVASGQTSTNSSSTSSRRHDDNIKNNKIRFSLLSSSSLKSSHNPQKKERLMTGAASNTANDGNDNDNNNSNEDINNKSIRRMMKRLNTRNNMLRGSISPSDLSSVATAISSKRMDHRGSQQTNRSSLSTTTSSLSSMSSTIQSSSASIRSSLSTSSSRTLGSKRLDRSTTGRHGRSHRSGGDDTDNDIIREGYNSNNDCVEEQQYEDGMQENVEDEEGTVISPTADTEAVSVPATTTSPSSSNEKVKGDDGHNDDHDDVEEEDNGGTMIAASRNKFDEANVEHSTTSFVVDTYEVINNNSNNQVEGDNENYDEHGSITHDGLDVTDVGAKEITEGVDADVEDPNENDGQTVGGGGGGVDDDRKSILDPSDSTLVNLGEGAGSITTQSLMVDAASTTETREGAGVTIQEGDKKRFDDDGVHTTQEGDIGEDPQEQAEDVVGPQPMEASQEEIETCRQQQRNAFRKENDDDADDVHTLVAEVEASKGEEGIDGECNSPPANIYVDNNSYTPVESQGGHDDDAVLMPNVDLKFAADGGHDDDEKESMLIDAQNNYDEKKDDINDNVVTQAHAADAKVSKSLSGTDDHNHVLNVDVDVSDQNDEVMSQLTTSQQTPAAASPSAAAEGAMASMKRSGGKVLEVNGEYNDQKSGQRQLSHDVASQDKGDRTGVQVVSFTATTGGGVVEKDGERMSDAAPFEDAPDRETDGQLDLNSPTVGTTSVALNTESGKGSLGTAQKTDSKPPGPGGIALDGDDDVVERTDQESTPNRNDKDDQPQKEPPTEWVTPHAVVQQGGHGSEPTVQKNAAVGLGGTVIGDEKNVDKRSAPGGNTAINLWSKNEVETETGEADDLDEAISATSPNPSSNASQSGGFGAKTGVVDDQKGAEYTKAAEVDLVVDDSYGDDGDNPGCEVASRTQTPRSTGASTPDNISVNDSSTHDEGSEVVNPGVTPGSDDTADGSPDRLHTEEDNRMPAKKPKRSALKKKDRVGKGKEMRKGGKRAKLQRKVTFSPKGIPQQRTFTTIPVVDLLKSPGAKSPGDKNLRRSKRARYRPLEHWRGESVVWGPNDFGEEMGDSLTNMTVPKGISKAEPTPYKKRKVARTVNKKKSKSKRSAPSTEDEVFDSTKLRKKYQFMETDEAYMWDEDYGQNLFQNVVSYASHLEGRDLPLPKQRQKSEGVVVGKAAQAFNVVNECNVESPEYIMGNLVLPPKGIKDSESVGKCAQTFTVVLGQPGALEVAYGYPTDRPSYTNSSNAVWDSARAQRFLLSPGDVFRVPPAGSYRLENHSKTKDCVLTWTILRPHKPDESLDDHSTETE